MIEMASSQRKGPSGPRNPILIRLYESCADVRAHFAEAYQYAAIAVKNRGIFYQTTAAGTDTMNELSAYLDAGNWAFILEQAPYRQFVSLGAPPYQQGTVYWDGDSWNCQTEFSDVTIQLGEENQILIVNKEAVDDMPDGTVAYAYGAQGQRLAVRKFANGLSVNGRRVMGLVTHNVARNQNGRLTNFGLVRNQNTQGLTVSGGVFTTATPGVWSQDTPPGDVESALIGFVVNAHPTDGSIFVNPQYLERYCGTTANRPTTPRLRQGQMFFDTTLGIPIWCKSITPAVVWVNSAGTTV